MCGGNDLWRNLGQYSIFSLNLEDRFLQLSKRILNWRNYNPNEIILTTVNMAKVSDSYSGQPNNINVTKIFNNNMLLYIIYKFKDMYYTVQYQKWNTLCHDLKAFIAVKFCVWRKWHLLGFPTADICSFLIRTLKKNRTILYYLHR